MIKSYRLPDSNELPDELKGALVIRRKELLKWIDKNKKNFKEVQKDGGFYFVANAKLKQALPKEDNDV